MLPGTTLKRLTSMRKLVVTRKKLTRAARRRRANA